MRQILLSFLLACVTFPAHAQKRGIMPSAAPVGRAGKSSTSAITTPMPTAVVPAAVDANQGKLLAPEVGENDAVITMHGLCTPDTQVPDPKSCTTAITRDQFEDILSAMSLSGQAFTAGAIRNAADNYVQNLVLADAALKQGIDKDPRIQKLLALVRMRTLAEAYRHAAEEKYRTPSQDEISKYYKDHLAQYEAVKADRLFVPKFNPKAPKEAAADFEKKARAVAEEIRVRAAKGEPFDKLQNEACARLGIPAPAFLPETGLRRRASYPSDVVDEIFALKPGEVTRIKEETGGFAMYRLLERDTYSQDQVKGEIVRDLFRQKMEADVKGVLQAVQTDMNSQYFAPAVSAQKTLPPGPVPGVKAPVSPRVQTTHSVKLPLKAGAPAPTMPSAKSQ